MSDGVTQGGGLGPLFFNFGLDELLTAVREAMRDLKVDSAMLGQVVDAVWSTDGRLDSGVHIPATDDLPLTLVAAPTYAEIDALAENSRRALRVSVRVGPPSDRRPTLPRYPGGQFGCVLRFFLSPISTIFIALTRPFCSAISSRISSGGEIVRWTQVQ